MIPSPTFSEVECRAPGGGAHDLDLNTYACRRCGMLCGGPRYLLLDVLRLAASASRGRWAFEADTDLPTSCCTSTCTICGTVVHSFVDDLLVVALRCRCDTPRETLKRPVVTKADGVIWTAEGLDADYARIATNATALCPDLLRYAQIGEADGWRGRLVRAFFWCLRAWPPGRGL